MKISGSIITLNEEDNIRECIKSLQRVCDEVVVLDSESADNTRQIAEEAGAKVVIQSYLGDGPQKSCAGKHASNDWVLSIDADERLDDELVNALRGLDLDKSPHDHYSFARKTFIGDTWIKVWYPDRVARLYNRNTADFEPIKGHAKVKGKSLGQLDGHIMHYSFEDYAELARTTVKFAHRGAKIFQEKQKPIGPLSPVTHAVVAFLRKYIGKKGILYGEPGFTISVMTAFGTYLKYTLARRYQNERK